MNDDAESSVIDVVEQEEQLDSSIQMTPDTLAAIEKVDAALTQVRGLEASDAELDELGGLAKDAFNNLMDLGMQVDSRFASEIFNSAGTMLGHAISAKTSKVNKKLKMIDLQLKKAELDRKIAVQATKNEQAGIGETTELGTGSVVDRNELIKMILNNAALSKLESKDK